MSVPSTTVQYCHDWTLCRIAVTITQLSSRVGGHSDLGNAPYVALTLDEVRFKAHKGGNRRKQGRPKAVPFTMDMLKKVQSTMENIIRDDPDRYANYGSFFFVLDCKGIKLWAKTSLLQEDASLTNVLLKNVPALDWPYMVDRENGELLVDLGIGINPSGNQTLVGLWRLDALEASFGAGGFLRGNIHHTCTLGHYGGIQAEMSQERGRQTHVAFRSAYNLSYEVVRPNDNRPTFVMDKDAYALNNEFMQECTQAISMYSGEAKRRSYGVRDEYRMSGIAMEHIMSELLDKVKTFLASDPILWISSEVWFEFLSRRVRALQLAQITIKDLDPPNFGILTGIVCHLIRCTSSTPIILDYHVRESMALLQFSRTSPLSAIQQHDDSEVLKLMEAKLQKKEGRPAWRIASQDDLEQFPIGNMPTWALLIKTIRDQPWLIMRAWMWTNDLSYFTCQLWMQIDEAWLIDPQHRPEPMSLQDAIKSWSLDGVFKTIRACFFKACNADIPGSTGAGRRQPGFAERTDIFFPEPSSNSKPARRSPWSIFWSKPGYIWEYHELVKEYSASGELEIVDRLHMIFSLLQTLPDASKGSSNTPGKTWKSEDNRIQSIADGKTQIARGKEKKVCKGEEFSETSCEEIIVEKEEDEDEDEEEQEQEQEQEEEQEEQEQEQEQDKKDEENEFSNDE
ncbi:hypothetical protein EV363DRAFT_1301410 [Boletus edulis]|nr:hypothetical protein EV363DRAFT_1301410 [Boletus edulis]